MKYLAIALLLGGCATTKDVDSLKLQLGATRHSLDETRYHVQIESCKMDALICAITVNTYTKQIENGELCVQSLESCLIAAQSEYHTKYGKNPGPLFQDPKRAR